MVLWTWTAKNCAQEIQEAGRQTCRFSGIWSFNIVVDLGLFDAQRSIYFFFSGRPSDGIPSKSASRSLGEQKGNILPSELLWMAHCHLKPAGSAQLRCFRTSSHKAGPGLPLLGPGGSMACLWWYSFFVADHRFHVCCLAEYGLEWPWTKQTLRGLGLVWDKQPHVPTTINLSPVFFQISKLRVFA